MIPRPPLPQSPVLVVGLARSGIAASLALRAAGLAVVATDSRAAAAPVRASLEAAGVEVRAGQDGVALLDRTRAIVKSPGVPQGAAVIAAARERGIAVIGELELGWRMLAGHEFIAVTGSNGKTTTVELIGHIHRGAGVPAIVAGNVGTALTSLPGTLEDGAVVVAEASSFQLEDTAAFAPEAAVLLNLAEDHLDRHGTFAAYRSAKLEVFAHQPSSAVAVVPAGLDLADARGAARRIRFGAGSQVAATGAAAKGGAAAGAAAAGVHAAGAPAAVTARAPDLSSDGDALRWRGTPLMPAREIRLRGPHNRENAMAAAAVCLARGIELAAVREGLATFAGVPHRLEEVATCAGVLYVNDSKATNVASAEVGIRSFAARVHLIAGGSAKGSDYRPLAAAVEERCASVHLIGETAPALRAALADTGIPLHDRGDLERAVAAAHAAARPGDVVLLCPACASFDQYGSYEERGAHFRALVAALS